jgi:hypothetical protein
MAGSVNMGPDTFIDPQLTIPDLLLLENLLRDCDRKTSTKAAHDRGTQSNGATRPHPHVVKTENGTPGITFLVIAHNIHKRLTKLSNSISGWPILRI